jgi:tRNA nucleotidyltransferase (CCA-adding enzyme)
MIPSDIGRVGIKRIVQKLGEQGTFKLLELAIADRLGSAYEYQNYSNIIAIGEMVKDIVNEEEPMSVSDLEINGYMMLELGYKPNKEMGLVMKEMLELVMEDASLNTAEYLVEYAKNKLNYF